MPKRKRPEPKAQQPRTGKVNVIQSLSVAAPSSAAQFVHHLNLLNHKSESQKKDSLSYLTGALSQDPSSAPPTSTILPKVQPLILDTSSTVRQQALNLLAELQEDDVRDNVEQLLLYARAALTNLSAKIRLTGLDLLEWLLNVAGPQLVSCPGGWSKTLKVIVSSLGWSQETQTAKVSGGWKSSGIVAATAKSGDEAKLTIRQLQVFSLLLEAGLSGSLPGGNQTVPRNPEFPLWNFYSYSLPKQSNPYGSLDLFGSRDEETEQYEDRDDRQRYFQTYVSKGVLKGVERMKREGGGIGRAALSLERAANTLSASVVE